ncbi:hypothetical protein P7C73_g3299, partial [Tremellales sp. Uapishka_1]
MSAANRPPPTLDAFVRYSLDILLRQKESGSRSREAVDYDPLEPPGHRSNVLYLFEMLLCKEARSPFITEVDEEESLSRYGVGRNRSGVTVIRLPKCFWQDESWDLVIEGIQGIVLKRKVKINDDYIDRTERAMLAAGVSRVGPPIPEDGALAGLQRDNTLEINRDSTPILDPREPAVDLGASGGDLDDLQYEPMEDPRFTSENVTFSSEVLNSQACPGQQKTPTQLTHYGSAYEQPALCGVYLNSD